MSEKTFKIVNGDISDGYHTFGELYEHRCLLFLAMLEVWRCGDDPPDCYRVNDHFDGWDLYVLYLGCNRTMQISYHIPAKYRYLGSWIKERKPEDHLWDGHTSADVVSRLRIYCGG